MLTLTTMEQRSLASNLEMAKLMAFNMLVCSRWPSRAFRSMDLPSSLREGGREGRREEEGRHKKLLPSMML